MDVKWDDRYNIGVEELDAQHQELFALIEECLGSQIADPLKYIMFLRELLDYCQWHFDMEEQFMERVGYPDRENHEQLHAEMKMEVERLVEQAFVGDNFDKAAVDEMIHSWIAEHVIKEDAKLKPYVQQDNAESAD